MQIILTTQRKPTPKRDNLRQMLVDSACSSLDLDTWKTSSTAASSSARRASAACLGPLGVFLSSFPTDVTVAGFTLLLDALANTLLSFTGCDCLEPGSMFLAAAASVALSACFIDVDSSVLGLASNFASLDTCFCCVGLSVEANSMLLSCRDACNRVLLEVDALDVSTDGSSVLNFSNTAASSFATSSGVFDVATEAAFCCGTFSAVLEELASRDADFCRSVFEADLVAEESSIVVAPSGDADFCRSVFDAELVAMESWTGVASTEGNSVLYLASTAASKLATSD
mmetsp:Transcript_39368/g.62394  ORF Transcript_39368/g.62394 Transcript_39368/m.62394 type:complete len:285 (+) Transcript_39368:406-1260(+)